MYANMGRNDMETPNGVNLYAKVNNRTVEITNELWDIENDDQAERTLTIQGDEFNNKEWLEAEEQELREKREKLMDAVTAQGTAQYE